jgi:hypothetical protein
LDIVDTRYLDRWSYFLLLLSDYVLDMAARYRDCSSFVLR